MISVKLSNKHLLTALVSLVLVLSLNINVFASDLISFYDYDFNAYYQTDSGSVNCTSTTAKSRPSSTADNGRLYTQYVFTLGGLNDRIIMTGADLDLYTNTEYEFDFQFFVSGSSCPTDVLITLWVSSQNDEGTIITIYDADGLESKKWINCQGTFKTPDFSGNVQYAMLVQLRENENSNGTTGARFCISDMACNPVGPLYGEEIMTPDTDDLSGNIQNYDDLIDSLPTVDSAQINDLMNFDFGSFIDGMNFIRDMFDRTLMTFNFNSVLLFSLVFGLACLILGRKAGK